MLIRYILFMIKYLLIHSMLIFIFLKNLYELNETYC